MVKWNLALFSLLIVSSSQAEVWENPFVDSAPTSFRQQTCEEQVSVAHSPDYDLLPSMQTAVYGVAIVVHGLNEKPKKMDQFAKIFQETGYDVFRVNLKGNRDVADEELHVKSEDWLKQVFLTYCEAKKRAGPMPIIFLGHSLGGLLGEALTNGALKEKPQFQKVILIAPALKVRGVSNLIRGLFFLGDQFKISSHSPPDYRANPATTVAEYRALFELKADVNATDYSASHQQTLVFYDPKDELVSPSGLKHLVKKRSLNEWQISTVTNDESTLAKKHHHLIVDDISVGAKQWAMMKAKILTFITEPVSSGAPPKN